jgi:hypothetical protein
MATHGPRRLNAGRPRDQPIVQSLVIPFAVVVFDKLGERVPEVTLS